MTLTVFPCFSFSSQSNVLVAHMLNVAHGLNEAWQYCTVSLEQFMQLDNYYFKILQKLQLLTLIFFVHILACLLLHCCMGLNETWNVCCTTSLDVHVV